MTDEEKEIITEQDQDDALLDNMESTLYDMRGDDSYDDVDSLDDDVDTIEARTDDEPKETPGEAAPGEQERTEAGEAAPAEAAADKDAGEDKDEPELDAEAQDAEDDEIHAAITNEKTAARFDQFRTQNKEMSGELDELTAAHDELKTASGTLFDYLDESQTSPEQLSAELAINKAINTGDFQAARPAFERMREMMRVVAVGLGDESVNDLPLGDELQGQVDNLDITPELAQKHAQLQAQQQLQGQYAQHQQQQTQLQQNDVAAKQQAAGQIKEWEDNLRTTDPDFTGKQQQILATAKQIMANAPPAQWLPALQQQYTIITDTQARLTQQQARQNASKPQPLRPGASSQGGAVPAPTSFEENFNQQLRGMRPNAQ